eukprot:7217178-Prymnesium_polylepis.1
MLHGRPPRLGSAGVWKSPARTFMTAPMSDARVPLPCSPGASAMRCNTRVQYCSVPPRSRVWSRCSPSGSCRDTAVGSYPPSLRTDHSASRAPAHPPCIPVAERQR